MGKEWETQKRLPGKGIGDPEEITWERNRRPRRDDLGKE